MTINPDIVRELLHYDPETDIFTWRERCGKWFKHDRSCKSWNARHPGNRAGYVHTYQSGYQCRFIRFLDKPRKEHRLAWLWMTDDPLPDTLDHKNRIATDNRWANIRTSSVAENNRNASMRRTNISGVTGVSWKSHSGKWLAQCKSNGKNHHIGLFDNIHDAAIAVEDFRVRNGFDPDHGRDVAHYV